MPHMDPLLRNHHLEWYMSFSQASNSSKSKASLVSNVWGWLIFDSTETKREGDIIGINEPDQQGGCEPSYPSSWTFTPPKFSIALEKWWLEDYFPIGFR